MSLTFNTRPSKGGRVIFSLVLAAVLGGALPVLAASKVAPPGGAIDAEKALAGKAPGPDAYKAAADAALHGAKKYKDNGFKVELAKRTVMRALTVAARTA